MLVTFPFWAITGKGQQVCCGRGTNYIPIVCIYMKQALSVLLLYALVRLQRQTHRSSLLLHTRQTYLFSCIRFNYIASCRKHVSNVALCAGCGFAYNNHS